MSRPRCRPPFRGSRRRVSTNVFHSPHPGQRPVQASAVCPHPWQTNSESRPDILRDYEPRGTKPRPGALRLKLDLLHAKGSGRLAFRLVVYIRAGTAGLFEIA